MEEARGGDQGLEVGEVLSAVSVVVRRGLVTDQSGGAEGTVVESADEGVLGHGQTCLPGECDYPLLDQE